MAEARAVAGAVVVRGGRGGTRRALGYGMPTFSRLALVAAVLSAFGARAAGAQVAGVIAPPPAPPPKAPPAVVAAKPTTSATARRDSLALAQRLDIQAWVDSAAGALASGAPATTVPLTPPPPVPDSARRDSTQRPTPRSRRPTPPRRPLGTPRPGDALAQQREQRDEHVVTIAR